MNNNAPAARMLRSGFAFEYRSPSQRVPGVLFPQFAKFRELARQLGIEAQVLAARGDWNGAMQARLDGLRFGSDLPRGGSLISALTGATMEAIARKDADKIVPRLSAQQARAAAKRLGKLCQNRVSFAEVMQEEKWAGLTLLKTVFSDSNWREQLARDDMDGEERKTLSEKIQYFSLDGDTVVKNHTEVLDTQVANARLPYGAPQKPPPKNLDIYTAQTSEYSGRFGFSFARNETANSLLLAALALRAFQAEHGSYPATLTELAPSYLSRVPLDPFGRGAALKYRRKNAREYSLYSVGPDGKDDGGQSKTPLRKDTTRRSQLNVDSRGDMVFGVNS